MSASLRDRVIVVTGAADGIGNATALGLAGEGAALVLTYLDAEGLGALRASFSEYRRATFVRVDVRRSSAVEELARQAVEQWGRVDAVINCAGVVIPGAIETTSAADIACQLDTNLGGTVNVARAFVPRFRRQGAGHLILIASLAGIVPLPGESIYAASKFAVRGFAHSIAHELRGSGVAVTVVCPDSTRTRMLDIEARGEGSSLSFASAAMDPADVARAILGALRRPRLEVLVPGFRGRLIRLLGAMPALFGLLYPLLDAMGRRRKARYRQTMTRRVRAGRLLKQVALVLLGLATACGAGPTAPKRNPANLRCTVTDSVMVNGKPYAFILASYHGALCDTLAARRPHNVTWG